MAVITISRGSFSGGKMLAECAAARLGYRCIDREVIVEKAAAYGVSQAEIRNALEKPPTVFILRMRHVPSVDATGINALDQFLRHCRKHGTGLILSGVRPQPLAALEKDGFLARLGPENVFTHIDPALARAKELIDAAKARQESPREERLVRTKL